MNLKTNKTKKTEDETDTESSEYDLELTKYKTAKRKERRSIFTVITLLVILMIVLGSIIYFSNTKKTSQLSAYGDRWNDISNFREHLLDQKDNNNNELYTTSSILSSPTVLRDLDNPEHCLYVAIGIEKEYSTDAVKAIIDFAWEGGSVIIADDYGYGNSFVEKAQEYDESFNIRFVGKQLWDENYEKDPRFIKINVKKDESKFFEGVILLNDPTALKNQNPTEKWPGRTMVSSSSKGWIDIDGDGSPTPYLEDEQMSKKPIIHELEVGDGKVVLISDPSIFINDMWSRENNSVFADALVRYLVPNTDDDNFKNNNTKLIIFDESLHIQENIISNSRQTFYQGLVGFTSDTQLAILIGILALLFLGVMIIIVDDPPSLRHRFNIDFYSLKELKNPIITAADCDRIRYIYLERLRMTHGLSIEEFKDLSYDELYDIIKDPDLVDFALEWDKKYYGEELENILIKIQKYF